MDAIPLALVLSALLFAAPAPVADATQDPAPAPPDRRGQEDEHPTAPVPQAPTATAKLPLVPGKLPADAAPEAAQAWRALCAATTPEGAGGPVTAFDMEFDVSAYSGERQSNDFQARYLYKEPGWVRTTIKKSGRERLRGPKGDFLVEKGKATRLVGRELAVDREELEDTVGIASTFVALTDPGAIRVARLELLAGAPATLPEARRKRGAELKWLSVSSPDFHRVGTSPERGEPLFRADIGLDPKTDLPALAVISRELVPESALLIELKDFRDVDSFQVPATMTTYRPDTGVSPWVFGKRPQLQLWLIRGSLRPDLKPADFEP